MSNAIVKNNANLFVVLWFTYHPYPLSNWQQQKRHAQHISGVHGFLSLTTTLQTFFQIIQSSDFSTRAQLYKGLITLSSGLVITKRLALSSG